MDAFDRLHPSIQYHVVNTLGWRDLRPLQRAAVAPIVEGDHALLVAPTAGGKTEAAVFPVLTRIADQAWRPLSTLYLCPLRALLNDLHPRLERYASYGGHRVGLWHGDVGAAERQRLVTQPPDVLLTTPESLEAILISTRVDARRLFANVRAAIIDEAHAFAGDDRGWHLLAVLARLQHITGTEIQRVGLSATVGNPDAMLEWLTPGAGAARRVVRPDAGSGAEEPGPEVMIDHVGSVAKAATMIARLHQGEKRLVFVDSRVRAEQMTQELRERGVSTYVSHAALARDERRQAELAFAEGRDCVIVATSTLELGIDVGDLDRVIQLDAPQSVASYLQRLGRSGRRAGSTRNMLLLTTRERDLWVTAGIARLWRQGWVEPTVAPPLPAHLVAHQLLALVLQEGTVGARLWPERLGPPFVLGGDVALFDDAVRDHMTGNGYLAVDQGMLTIGREAEARFGRRHFIELTSVFTAPPTFTVLAGRREIGQVHDLGIMAAYQVRGGPPVLLLGGRGWRILDVDWRRRRVHVELTESRGRTNYHGAGQPMSRELAQSIAAVLAGGEPLVPLSRRATSALDDSRAGFPGLRPERSTLLRRRPDGRAEWFTFAGLRANLELAARLGPVCRSVRGTDDLGIALVDDVDVGELRAGIDRTTPVDDLLDLAEEATAGIKFADCIPRWLADAVVLARLTDHPSVEATLALPIDAAHVSPDAP
jgi:ATP-dependent Lhr-like helicase